jgi:hypothetical protein
MIAHYRTIYPKHLQKAQFESMKATQFKGWNGLSGAGK